MKIGGSRQNMNEYLEDMHEPILQCSHLILLIKLTPVQKPQTNPVAQCNAGRFFGRLKRGIPSPVSITAATFPMILYLPLWRSMSSKSSPHQQIHGCQPIPGLPCPAPKHCCTRITELVSIIYRAAPVPPFKFPKSSPQQWNHTASIMWPSFSCGGWWRIGLIELIWRFKYGIGPMQGNGFHCVVLQLTVQQSSSNLHSSFGWVLLFSSPYTAYRTASININCNYCPTLIADLC